MAWAGVLAAGDPSRVGGTSAAHLEGLQVDPPDHVLVLVPHGRVLASCERWRFVRERAGARDPRSVGAPPCTTIEDTVLDLCATARPQDVVGWATIAVQRRRTTPARLLAALDRRRRHPRRALLRALLEDVGVGAESPLEITYLRDVERAHGLPRAVRQGPSRDRRALRDVRYPAYRVVVELDGRLGHTGLGRFRDMDRDCLVLLAPAYALTPRSSSRTRRQRSAAAAAIWSASSLGRPDRTGASAARRSRS